MKGRCSFIRILSRCVAATALVSIAVSYVHAADGRRTVVIAEREAPFTQQRKKIVVAAAQGDPTYVVTGAHAADSTPGVSLLRSVGDDSTGGGTILHSGDSGLGTTVDTWSSLYSLPFPFKLYGQIHHSFSVSKSGLLTFSAWAAEQEVRDAEPPDVSSTIKGVASSAPAQAAHTTTAFAYEASIESTTFQQGKAQPDEIVVGGGSSADTLPLAYLPPATIAYFYDPVLLPSTHVIRGFVYGDAPFRQLWVVNEGQRKRAQGHTYTALVLEETTHRILMVDMWTEVEPATGKTIVGVQRNQSEADDVPASPKVPVTGLSSSASDNAFYLFQPDTVGSQINGDGHSSLAAIDEYMANFINDKATPGATVAVSYNGRLIFSKGYGWADVERRIPMQDWHRAQMGSVTKMLTAVGVFKLLELNGLGSAFDLDMPLYGAGGVLPELEFQQALLQGIDNGIETGKFTEENLWWNAYHDITIRNLLTHTSGFARSGDSVGAAEAFGIDYEDLGYEDVHLHFLSEQPLKSLPALVASGSSNGDIGAFEAVQPKGPKTGLAELVGSSGARRSYSNHGFGLLGHIIARTSGMPYRTFLHEYVLDAVGLDAIDLAPVHWHDKTVLDAKRYFHYSKGLPYVVSLFDGSRVYGAYGYKPMIDNQGATGSWVTSARDLVRFMCALDGLGNQADILEPASLAEMESVPYPDAIGASNQPHGWDSVSASGRFAKNGQMGFGAAQIYRGADGISVAIVANTGVPGGLSTPASAVYNLAKSAVDAVPWSYDLFDSTPQIAVKP